MELIPILATIILMATISTFFLAVGAYILYKIRERRGSQQEVVQPSTIQAELVTPEAVADKVQTIEREKAPAPVIFEQPRAPQYKPAEPAIVKQREQQQIRAQGPPQPIRPEPPRAPAAGPGTPVEQKFVKVATQQQEQAKQEEKQRGAARWR